ncbi:MAG: hypothetical protein ACFFFC_00345 [Candidatus Thorarchaeota archaeon]
MSNELEEILSPSRQIPWDSAACFFVAVKDATKIAQCDEDIVTKFRRGKSKKAEMTKFTKTAQGEPGAGVEEDYSKASDTSIVEPAAIKPPAPPKKTSKKNNAVTPEQKKMQQSAMSIAQEQVEDKAGKVNEASYYKQTAEEMSAQAEQLQAMLEEAQVAAQQASEQAQMSQMQADQAVQQSTMQAQQDAFEKQQLADENIQARQNLMQLRQAMMAYRENLQQLVLQDPTAIGIIPEEQGMVPQPGMEGAEGLDDQAALEQEAAQEAAQETAQEAKQEKPKNKQPVNKQDKNNEKSAVTVNVEKRSSVLPEYMSSSFYKKAASLRERAIGAAIGAGLGGGIQSLSDIKSKGGESAKEKALRFKLQELQERKDGGPFHKHKVNLTRFLYETAKTNREHPQSAAAMAALTGAGLGAAVGPDVGKGVRSVFTQFAQRGGK